jgi:hypothetical protein
MSSETPQEKLNLCTRCRQRPFVYGNEKDGMCEMCFAIRKAEITPPNAQQQQAAGLANSPNLNARQKAALKRRAPKPQPICEENWGGPCRGGCGKYNQGEYFCYDCRTKQAEKNFMIQPGQVELVRHAVGKVEDKIVKQVVVTDASSIEMEEMLWLWPNRIDLPTDQLHQATLNARNALFEKCVETHKHAVDVLLPYCEEIIRRYKMQGVWRRIVPTGSQRLMPISRASA